MVIKFSPEIFRYQCMAGKKDIGPELGFCYENECRHLNLEPLILDQVCSGITRHAIATCLWFSEGEDIRQRQGGWQGIVLTEICDIWPKSTSCPNARVIIF